MPTSETGEKQQKHQLDREIRDMISALTHRLSNLQKKSGPSSSFHGDNQDEQDEDREGVSIITMAGSNEGATMKGELDLVSMEENKPGSKERDEQVLPPLTTYLNSNFQSVNNSIMVGGGYKANDPGIHLDVTDYYQGGTDRNRYGRKGKKKVVSESSSKSEHHSD